MTRLNDAEREVARDIHVHAVTSVIADRDDLLDAVRALATIWDALCDVAHHFSCGEIEELLDLLRLGGLDDLEALVRWHHAQSDEDGDYESHLALIGTNEPREVPS